MKMWNFAKSLTEGRKLNTENNGNHAVFVASFTNTMPYLLTPMDRTMLPHAQSTIFRCTQSWMPSVITRQQALVDVESTLLQILMMAVGCYHKCALAAQTPLVRFVVNVLFKEDCNKSQTNRTNGV